MAQDHLYRLQRVVYRVQLKSDPPFDPKVYSARKSYSFCNSYLFYMKLFVSMQLIKNKL